MTPAIEVCLKHCWLVFTAGLCCNADTKVYRDITDQEKMLHVVGEYLSDMNAGSKKPQNLVLFQFALEHLARISRVITSPGGNALLVGLGGSGRQSLTRLAAFMQDMEVFQVRFKLSYSMIGQFVGHCNFCWPCCISSKCSQCSR